MEFHCKGLLFDMDGTLLDSTASMHRIWSDWATRHGFEPEAFIAKIHGVKGIDNILALNLAGVDPVAEALEIERREIEDVEGVVPLAGAIAFLDGLPPDCWAIVTSAPLLLAKARLEAAGIKWPRHVVTGGDVQRGKPDPDCFLQGAAKLGFAAQECLAFEDAPAGIAAAHAAGCKVIVVTATHRETYTGSHPAISSYTNTGWSQHDENLIVRLTG